MVTRFGRARGAWPGDPLSAGRYALVCFFSDTADPEMTAHAEKGMVAEFTIGSGDAPTDGEPTDVGDATEEGTTAE